MTSRAPCIWTFIYNRFRNFNKSFLHQLAQNEGNNSLYPLSKNAVSNETCGVMPGAFLSNR